MLKSFFFFFLFNFPGQTYDIQQSPSDLLINAGEYQELYCNHSVSSFRNILWYQQSIGDTSLKLIANVYYTSVHVDSSFVNRFNISGDGAKHSTLHLNKLRAAEDSAVYYCACGSTDPAAIAVRKCPVLLLDSCTVSYIKCIIQQLLLAVIFKNECIKTH
uniref:Ig-like domain-containing protein n=1 Tax=Astyanax mexicanus TaxID=7994 RepID=A0A8B9H2S9_ASTMX